MPSSGLHGMVAHTRSGRLLQSKLQDELISVACSGANALIDMHWFYRGCIFETICIEPSQIEATERTAYATSRSQWPCSAAVCQLLFGPKMLSLAATLLQTSLDTADLQLSVFNDQVHCIFACSNAFMDDYLQTQSHLYVPRKYIVKPPNCLQSRFSWHRDSDRCCQDAACDHAEYLSLWCALDDTTTGMEQCIMLCCCAYRDWLSVNA